MTELFEHAVARIRSLAPERQDEFARLLLRLAGEKDLVYALTFEEQADLIASDGEIERGEFATEAEVEGVFSKFRI